VNNVDKKAVNAVDRFYVPSHHGMEESSSVALSTVENSPWIQVDLIISYYVYGVKIWQRSESQNASKCHYLLYRISTASFLHVSFSIKIETNLLHNY